MRRLGRRLMTIRTRQLRKLCHMLWYRDLRRALFRGTAAGIEHLGVLRQLHLATVVDVGANVGQFALAVAHVHPRARIIAFEPLARPARVFEGVFAGAPQVHLHRVAIGPSEGLATMHVAERDDSSSLLPISEAQVSLFPWSQRVGIEKVRMAPLHRVIRVDDILPPALLKVDVQGYELNALKACEKFLWRFRYIYVEVSFLPLYVGQCNALDIFMYLSNQGYWLEGIYNIYYACDGRAVQADLLFEKVVP